MSSAAEIAARVIAALNAADIPHMLVGAFSRNFYTFPRSTQDMDITVSLQAHSLRLLVEALGSDFALDEQVTFETNTGTFRDTLLHVGTGFKVELFHLSSDPHDQERFARRRAVLFDGQPTAIPTAEDVIVTKLRWARDKDLADVRDVIAVQGDAALDWDYIHRWTAQHGTRARLDAIRASIPPLE
jgi:hypothetical protein